MLRLRRRRTAKDKTRIGKFGIVQTDCNRARGYRHCQLGGRLLAFFESPTIPITGPILMVIGSRYWIEIKVITGHFPQSVDPAIADGLYQILV